MSSKISLHSLLRPAKWAVRCLDRRHNLTTAAATTENCSSSCQDPVMPSRNLRCLELLCSVPHNLALEARSMKSRNDLRQEVCAFSLLRPAPLRVLCDVSSSRTLQWRFEAIAQPWRVWKNEFWNIFLFMRRKQNYKAASWNPEALMFTCDLFFTCAFYVSLPYKLLISTSLRSNGGLVSPVNFFLLPKQKSFIWKSWLQLGFPMRVRLRGSWHRSTRLAILIAVFAALLWTSITGKSCLEHVLWMSSCWRDGWVCRAGSAA